MKLRVVDICAQDNIYEGDRERGQGGAPFRALHLWFDLLSRRQPSRAQRPPMMEHGQGRLGHQDTNRISAMESYHASEMYVEWHGTHSSFGAILISADRS